MIPVSIGGELHAEVEDKYRKFLPFTNGEMDATKKDKLYADILQIWIK